MYVDQQIMYICGVWVSIVQYISKEMLLSYKQRCVADIYKPQYQLKFWVE